MRPFVPVLMRRLRLTYAAPLLLLHCMPDFDALSAGRGGSGGAGGAGGSSGVTGGGSSGEGGQPVTSGGNGSGGTGEVGGVIDSAGAGGMSGTEGTEAGAGGVAPTEPPCGGCARASVPLQMGNTGQAILIYYPSPVDLTGVTITVRVRAPGARAGVLQIFAQDDKFAADYNFSTPLILYPQLTDVAYVIPSGLTGYNTARIQQITVSVATGAGPGDCASAPATCPWTQPTLLDIDSITLTGGPPGTPGPYTFDTDTVPLSLATFQPVPGSTLFWIP